MSFKTLKYYIVSFDHKRFLLQKSRAAGKLKKKITNMCKLNSTFLNNQWEKEKITWKLENTISQRKTKTQHKKTYGSQ